MKLCSVILFSVAFLTTLVSAESLAIEVEAAEATGDCLRAPDASELPLMVSRGKLGSRTSRSINRNGNGLEFAVLAARSYPKAASH